MVVHVVTLFLQSLSSRTGFSTLTNPSPPPNRPNRTERPEEEALTLQSIHGLTEVQIVRNIKNNTCPKALPLCLGALRIKKPISPSPLCKLLHLLGVLDGIIRWVCCKNAGVTILKNCHYGTVRRNQTKL